MSFNPLDQTGIPVDEQFRSWRELNVDRSTSRAAIRTRAVGSW